MSKHSIKVSIEPKSRLSSDDWRKLGGMMRLLQMQERRWLEEFERKQQKARGMMFIGTIWPDWTIKDAKAAFKGTDIFAIARDKNDVIVGFCTAECKKELTWATCTGLYVDKDFRGKGIATKLMKAMLGRAKENGFFNVELRASIKNKAAIALYKKFGFVHTAWQMETWL